MEAVGECGRKISFENFPLGVCEKFMGLEALNIGLEFL